MKQQSISQNSKFETLKTGVYRIHGNFKIIKAPAFMFDKDLKTLKRLLVTFHETRINTLEDLHFTLQTEPLQLHGQLTRNNLNVNLLSNC